jgi:competence protein ComEC
VRRFTGDYTWGDGHWGGLALALLLGIRDNLDTGLTALYRTAGCSYILALSGMHLAVLVAVISFLLKKPLGLRAAAIAGATIIIVYCFIVGPLPSLNRSALMYLLGVLAVLGMLKRDSLSVLCMAFLIQITVTPQAGFSLSFILSYLALTGILIIGKFISNIFSGTVPPFILQPLSLSLGAFIATAGIVSWFFNDLRPAGILAGLIIAPLTTVFMIGSMAWLGLDMIHPSLSSVMGKPLSVLYWLKEKTVFLASYIPGVRANPFTILALSLLVVALLVWIDYRRRTVADHLEPFA